MTRLYPLEGFTDRNEVIYDINRVKITELLTKIYSFVGVFLSQQAWDTEEKIRRATREEV